MIYVINPESKMKRGLNVASHDIPTLTSAKTFPANENRACPISNAFEI